MNVSSRSLKTRLSTTRRALLTVVGRAESFKSYQFVTAFKISTVKRMCQICEKTSVLEVGMGVAKTKMDKYAARIVADKA